MSEQNETPEFPPAAVDAGTAALANAIVAAVNANQGPRKIGVARFLRERSLHRGKGYLTRAVQQNGIDLDESMLNADGIKMLNVLKPGMYCNGVFVVIGLQNNGINITYNNKSPDDRWNLRSAYPTFNNMLAAMLREQEQVS